MKKIAFLSVFLVVMGLAIGAQAYTFTTYSSYGAWLLAAPGPYGNENFQAATIQIPGLSITEVGGAGVIQNGVYENVVDKDVPRYQVFNYAPKMNAFGVFIDLVNPGGAGTGINMYIDDDNTLVYNIPNTAAGEFYGFVADGKFSGVRLEDAAGAGIQETYMIIDLNLAPVTVPEPASMLLLGLGLLGVGIVSRKK